MVDHVHMMLSVPPKYPVSQVVGFIRGKSAVWIARNYLGKKKDFTGMSFGVLGYFVSTIGQDEQMVREYIQNQEKEDQRLDQLGMFK